MLNTIHIVFSITLRRDGFIADLRNYTQAGCKTNENSTAVLHIIPVYCAAAFFTPKEMIASL